MKHAERLQNKSSTCKTAKVGHYYLSSPTVLCGGIIAAATAVFFCKRRFSIPPPLYLRYSFHYFFVLKLPNSYSSVVFFILLKHH